MKAFIDRWSCGLSTDEERFRRHMYQKPVAAVVPPADNDLSVARPLIEGLRLSCGFLDMRFVGTLQVVADSRADVSNSPEAINQSMAFGHMLRQYVP